LQPAQPANEEELFAVLVGVAMRSTRVPTWNCLVSHVPGQLMPRGREVTVPEPVILTTRFGFVGGGGGAVTKKAPVLMVPLTMRSQFGLAPRFEQSPPQRLNVACGPSGVAVNRTWVPGVRKFCEQVPGHEIPMARPPPLSEVTTPGPPSVTLICSATKVAVTVVFPVTVVVQ
jgi:hypothetical protein